MVILQKNKSFPIKIKGIRVVILLTFLILPFHNFSYAGPVINNDKLELVSIFQTLIGEEEIVEEIKIRYDLEISLEKSDAIDKNILKTLFSLQDINIKSLLPVIASFFEYKLRYIGDEKKVFLLASSCVELYEQGKKTEALDRLKQLRNIVDMIAQEEHTNFKQLYKDILDKILFKEIVFGEDEEITREILDIFDKVGLENILVSEEMEKIYFATKSKLQSRASLFDNLNPALFYTYGSVTASTIGFMGLFVGAIAISSIVGPIIEDGFVIGGAKVIGRSVLGWLTRKKTVSKKILKVRHNNAMNTLGFLLTKINNQKHLGDIIDAILFRFELVGVWEEEKIFLLELLNKLNLFNTRNLDIKVRLNLLKVLWRHRKSQNYNDTFKINLIRLIGKNLMYIDENIKDEIWEEEEKGILEKIFEITTFGSRKKIGKKSLDDKSMKENRIKDLIMQIDTEESKIKIVIIEVLRDIAIHGVNWNTYIAIINKLKEIRGDESIDAEVIDVSRKALEIVENSTGTGIIKIIEKNNGLIKKLNLGFILEQNVNYIKNVFIPVVENVRFIEWLGLINLNGKDISEAKLLASRQRMIAA